MSERANNFTVEPLTGMFAFTKSDTVNEPIVGRGLMVSADGNVKVVFENGDTVTLALKAGVLYPFMLKRVFSTGTDAVTCFGGK